MLRQTKARGSAMTKIADLKKLTANLGGIFHEFSQSYAQIKAGRSIAGLYTNDKGTTAKNNNELYIGGMCHTMSMYWVVGQTKGVGPRKGSFIDWVVPKDGSVNMEAVGALVSKTAMYKAKGGAAKNLGILKDPNFDDDFFARHDIKDKYETCSGFDAIKRTVGRSKDRFWMISYGSGTGGHACAAQSTRQGGFAYFDPNYGEALLFKRSAWEAWYDEYLRISTYQTKYQKQAAYGYKSKHSG
jgi:hypothetical protein